MNRIVNRRFAAYRVALAQRRLAIQSREHRRRCRGQSGSGSGTGGVGAGLHPVRGARRAGGHPPPARHHQNLLMLKHAFYAMGTTFELAVEAETGLRAFAEAEAEVERLEQIMSRFRPDSELSHLNRDGVLDASQDLAEVVELALAARERTSGRFDPTIHDALVGAGYDRTFQDIQDDTDATARAAACGGGVTLAGRRIELEPGVKLDLGGIGEGFAAERVATRSH